jgi:hypothetical protein
MGGDFIVKNGILAGSAFGDRCGSERRAALYVLKSTPIF